MRKRTRHTPNTSESTGKIGQELPQDQPRPLVPNYEDEPAPQPRIPLRKAPVAPVAEPRRSPAVATRSPKAAPARQPAPVSQTRPASQPAPVSQTRPARQAPSATSGNRREQRIERNQRIEDRRIELETQPDLPSLPSAELQPADRSSQVLKGYVILAIGLPGSGKTTWFKRRGVTPLSSDLLRNILFDDVEEQRYQGLVFSTLRSLLRARLIAHMPWNYVDATNLSTHERRQWIKMSTSFGYEVQAVFFDVPLDVCLERNSRRERTVSEDVMRKMAERLKPPVFEEGFAKITVVRVKSAS